MHGSKTQYKICHLIQKAIYYYDFTSKYYENEWLNFPPFHCSSEAYFQHEYCLVVNCLSHNNRWLLLNRGCILHILLLGNNVLRLLKSSLILLLRSPKPWCNQSIPRSHIVVSLVKCGCSHSTLSSCLCVQHANARSESRTASALGETTSCAAPHKKQRRLYHLVRRQGRFCHKATARALSPSATTHIAAAATHIYNAILDIQRIR